MKPSFVKPLSDVAAIVKAKVAEEQRKAAAAAEAKQVISRLKSPEDFTSYAKSRGFKVENAKVTATMTNIPGVGSNAEFRAAAFRLDDKTPFGLSVQGDQSHLLRYKKRSMQNPEKMIDRKIAISQELTQDWQNYFLDSELKQLRKDLRVKILIPEMLRADVGTGS
jgi:ppGpp synthetase/RelA/SpoT-type nucleotidyltranferase